MIKQRLYNVKLIALAIALPFLCYCATTGRDRHYSGKGSSLAGSPAGGFSEGATSAVLRPTRNSWELWQPGLGNRGDELTSISLLDGDAQLQKGDREGAIAAYQRALTQGLRSNEAEAAQYRLLALELALGQNDQVLKQLSDYFRAANRGVEAVGPDFSLLFGYAYAFRGDSEQALAWLARANNKDRPNGTFAGVAQDEITILVKTIPEAKFEEEAATWESDDYIRVAMAHERARRAHGGTVEALQRPQSSGSPTSLATAAQSVQLGVLLPLSGRFSALGRNVENGIELAVEGQGGVGTSILSVQDSGDSSESAASAARTLFESKNPSIVLGPLISEQAGAVRSVAEALRIPLISFSKRSDFAPGGSIFRLGVTNESQIDSLLETAHDRLGVTAIAMIHPDDLGTQDVTELFRIRARELGLNIVYEGTYAHDDPKGAAGVAAALETQKVDGVFFSGGSAVAANVYAGLPEAFRAKVRPMGIGNWDNTSQLMNSRTVLKGAIFVSPFFAQSKRPIVQGFVTSYAAKFQQQPDFLAAQGFDAATLALQALHMAHQNNSDIVTALRSIDAYEGLTGKVYIGADGELRRAFAVLELQENGLVEINNVDAAAVSAQVLPVDAAATPVVAPPSPL